MLPLFFESSSTETRHAILAIIFSLSKKCYLKIEEKNIKKSNFYNKYRKEILKESGKVRSDNINKKWDQSVFNFVTKLTDMTTKFLNGIYSKMKYESVFMSELKTSVDEKKLGWTEYPPRSATLRFTLLNFILFFATLILLVYNITASIIGSAMICFFGLVGCLSDNLISLECSKLKNKWTEFSP